jgi:acetate kinase
VDLAVLSRAMNILVLNGGSSSIKAAVYAMDGALNARVRAAQPLWKAKLDFQHRGTPEGLAALVESAWSGPSAQLRGPGDIHAVGHRIVHGGKAFRESTRITPEVKAAIVELASFAPEHNLLEVEAIEAVERMLPRGVAQVAVFDTAFHSTLPPEEYTYPGPYAWLGEGIRRYGFHGISHQYVSRCAAEMLGRDLAALRMITCHLGNGCSLAAVREGRSVATTMGFTPLEGLMMGTRSGTVDPGILIHLVRHRGSSAEDLDRILNKESGLEGISGVSGDMREVLAAAGQGNARARLAFDVYVHRLCAAIGSLLPSLRGLDVIVFTGGVGENCAPLRKAAGEALAFLGVAIDTGRNEAPLAEDGEISQPGAAVRVLMVRTAEEWEIARECARVVCR